MQKTLIIIKPHAVERGLVGTFLERFERMGLRLIAMRVVRESSDFWERFYPSDQQWLENVGSKTLENCKLNNIDVEAKLGTADAGQIGQMVKSWLVDHMVSSASVAVVLEGNEAQLKVRTACGATLPNKAVPGTIRFDYSVDSPTPANAEQRPVFNLIHASDPDERRDGVPAASYETGLMFPDLA